MSANALIFSFLDVQQIWRVTTNILVVGSERINSTPIELFENLILLQIVSKYVY